jgi:hypothetical protein
MKPIKFIKTLGGQVIDLSSKHPNGNFIIRGSVLLFEPHDTLQRSTAKYLGEYTLDHIIAKGTTIEEVENFEMPNDFTSYRVWCNKSGFKPSNPRALQRYNIEKDT